MFAGSGAKPPRHRHKVGGGGFCKKLRCALLLGGKSAKEADLPAALAGLVPFHSSVFAGKRDHTRGTSAREEKADARNRKPEMARVSGRLRRVLHLELNPEAFFADVIEREGDVGTGVIERLPRPGIDPATSGVGGG